MTSKNKYLEKASRQLEEWDYELNRLEARLDDIQDEFKHKLEERLNHLKKERQTFKAKVKDFEETSEEAWEDIKEGLEMAWDSIKLGFLSARSEFLSDEDRKEKEQ